MRKRASWGARAWRWRAIAFICTLTAASSGLVARPMGAGAALDPCLGQWTPMYRDSVVTQGVGGASGYAPLARDKTTLARLFITAPACAPADSEVITSATVTAIDDTGTVLAKDVPTTPSPIGSVSDPGASPKLDPFASPTNDGKGNPIFLIKHFAETAANPGQFTAKFTFTVTYEYLVGTTWTSGQATYTGSPTTPVTADVAPASKPLRVLVVPMGDTGIQNYMAAQFPESKNKGTPINGQYADTVLQAGMQAVARILPAADGTAGVGDVGDLTSTSAGLRYRLDDANMIDLGPRGLNVMANGVYCAFKNGQDNWSPVASKLAAYLDVWNTQNPSATADRVIGAMWQTASQGLSSCAEGLGSFPSDTSPGQGRTAYVRLVADPAPSITGPLIVHELSHTLGALQPSDTRNRYGDGHSINQYADPSNANRSYNISLAQWMAAPLSIMRYSGSSAPGTSNAWSGDTTLYETPDYLYAQCQITPGMNDASHPNRCPATSTVGGTGQVGPSFVITGTSDGTPEHTNIHSYFTSSTVEQTPPTTGGYTLVQYDANGGSQSFGVPFSFLPDEQTGSPTQNPGTVSLYGVVPPIVNVVAFELRSPTGVVLYRRTAGDPPTITSSPSPTTIGNLQDFTNAAGDDTQPAFAASGRFLAWVTSTGIVVQGRELTTNLPTGTKSAALAGSSPAWSPDGKSVAYVASNGDINIVPVNTATDPPTWGTPITIYNHLGQQLPPLLAVASHPSYSPDGAYLAVAINGGIWRITTGGGSNSVICALADVVATSSCAPVATDGTDSAPTWGAFGGTGSGLVAYVNGTDVFTVDPNQPRRGARRIANAAAPAWGSNVLAFVRNGSVWLANSSVVNSDGTYATSSAALTSGSLDATPALTPDGQAIAFDRIVDAVKGHDVFDGTLDNDSNTITVTASTSDDARNLRLDMVVACAGAQEPIFANEPPTTTSNGNPPHDATWTLQYDDNNGCPGGVISVAVTDGYERTDLTPIRTIPSNPDPGTNPAAAAAAIGSPSSGSIYLQYDAIVATGSGISATDGTNGPGTQLSWTLTDPAGKKQYRTGGNVEFDPQFPSGWASGTHTLCLVVTNADGVASPPSCVNLKVLPDPQNRGTNVIVKFNPHTLYVPSNGTDVTLQVIPQQQDLRKISASTVRISQIGNSQVDIPVDTASGTKGWVSNGDGSYTAKFVRQTLTCAMAAAGFTGGYVPVVLTASSSSFEIRGYDPQYPIVSPADPPVTCP